VASIAASSSTATGRLMSPIQMTREMDQCDATNSGGGSDISRPVVVDYDAAIDITMSSVSAKRRLVETILQDGGHCKEFPNLRIAAGHFLSISASSVPVENMFSCNGFNLI
jgi:hypothetical protein